ncbi:Cys/Met metabolism PLP-dependent enzyme-domain-containing protein [Leptodontidium sp. 2 PMI_412]|nr:Cys/Met metabolism PLP-dependent enzyme-domain-containing protein [Leptodontidium sp. 2 PMI_412]
MPTLSNAIEARIHSSEGQAVRHVRAGQPHDNFERAVAALEDAKYALTFSSELASNLHIISIADLYSGTRRLHAHQIGVLVVVDTFLSSYIQSPLHFGAGIVLLSVTKYVNGHSDVLMGVIAFDSPELKHKLSFLHNAIRSVPSPFDCWLAHRGLKTLHLRARAALKNASSLALALEASPRVLAVHYPGLSSHPQRHAAETFPFGFEEAGMQLYESTRYFTLAESLGGVESLCEVPARMTHVGVSKEVREASGVYDDLIRLSVGIEDERDLLNDLLQAIERVVM